MKIPYLPAKHLVLFIILLCSSRTGRAQELKIPASQKHLYQIQNEIYDHKFYREHLPLDGAIAGAIPFRQDSLYGFVDKRTKEWLVKPRFSQVFAVYESSAIVEEKEGPYGGSSSYGLVDLRGNYLIAPHFGELYREGEIYHGLASASDPKVERESNSFIYNAYFSPEGKLLIALQSHDWATFLPEDSIAWSRYGPEYTVFGRSGTILKKFAVADERLFLGVFRNTLVFAEAPRTEEQAYVGYNLKGKELWRLRWTEQVTAVVQMSANAFGVLSEDGFFILDGESNVADWGIQNDAVGFGFDGIFPQLNALELIPVCHFETEKWGFVNRQGRLVIPCKYRYAGNFYNGEAPVEDSATGLIGFINTRGKMVVPPFMPADNLEELETLDAQPRFGEGLCRVQLPVTTIENGSTIYHDTGRGGLPYYYAYFNRAGRQQFRLPDGIVFASNFASGRAPVVVGKARDLGFTDTTGKLVIAAKYETAMAGAYPFPQVVMPEFKGGYAYLKAWKGYVGADGYEYFSGKRVEDHYDFSH